MANGNEGEGTDRIEFIDLSQTTEAEAGEEISTENLDAIRAALIKAVREGAFDPLMKQVITGKPLTQEEEDRVSAAAKKVVKLKHD